MGERVREVREVREAKVSGGVGIFYILKQKVFYLCPEFVAITPYWKYSVVLPLRQELNTPLLTNKMIYE
jgi:hypothetical protein